jgi:protein-S-isoprenylcysteine O-methyltransferase Ste14
MTPRSRSLPPIRMTTTTTVSAAVPATARLLRAAAAVAVVALACAIYALAPYNREQMERLYGSVALSFSGYEFLFTAAALYAAAVVAFHLVAAEAGPTKSMRFFLVLARLVRAPRATLRAGLDREDRVALLATVLKSFFAPMMVMSLMNFCMSALAHGAAIVGDLRTGLDAITLFNLHGFWILMQTIFFVDVLIFTVGYLVESPRLGNEIRSVDPTLLGWAAALLCYPPFNYVTGKILGSQVSDFPQFDNPTLHLTLNIAMLVLMAIYSWASVALGLKASNLTHRGIVARGPYAVVRHPAYVCKNLAWWISAIPLVSIAFGQSLQEGILAVASVAGWSMLYVLRAITEEDHLRSVDGEYAAYAARVRYRFVPGVY